MSKISVNKFVIPKTFQTRGSEITVIRRSQEFFETNCQYGCWVEAEQELTLRKGLHIDIAEHTFWHEFYHVTFDALGYYTESANERLIDGMAGITHQMLKTGKGNG